MTWECGMGRRAGFVPYSESVNESIEAAFQAGCESVEINPRDLVGQGAQLATASHATHFIVFAEWRQRNLARPDKRRPVRRTKDGKTEGGDAAGGRKRPGAAAGGSPKRRARGRGRGRAGATAGAAAGAAGAAGAAAPASASDPIFSRDSIQQQIDAAVSAMAKLEPDEQRKQIKDLRLKYHP